MTAHNSEIIFYKSARSMTFNAKDQEHNITVHLEYEKDTINQQYVHFENV